LCTLKINKNLSYFSITDAANLISHFIAIGTFIGESSQISCFMWNWFIIFVTSALPVFSRPGLPPDALLIQEGKASYYGRRFNMKLTSSGEVFNIDSLTAAHKTLPFGTMVKVSRIDNGDFVWVKVNDRLPKNSKNIIDLSRKAAKNLDLLHDGVTEVKIEVQNLSELNSLIEYYSEGRENSLRLRPVDLGIDIERQDLDTGLDLSNK
jgi:rare lipoprotein A